MFEGLIAKIAAHAIFGKAIASAKADAVAAGKWFSTLSGPQLFCLILAGLLAVDHIGLVLAHRHSRKVESQLALSSKALADTRSAFTQTVANYRAAADQARKSDAANKLRVETAQKAINERHVDEYQTRIADADARYQRMRQQAAAAAAADPGGRGAASVSGPDPDRPAPAGAPGQDGLSLDDRHLATRQAIQLDELIKAINELERIDVNANPPPDPPRQ